MEMETLQYDNNVKKIAFKSIRFSVALITIALITSLASNSMLQSIYGLETVYANIIYAQEASLASINSFIKENETTLNVVQLSKETNRIIIKFKEDAKLPPGLRIADERANLEKAQGLKKLLTISGINADVYEITDNDTAQEVVDGILSSKKDIIEYAEVDRLVAPDLIPNDPLFPSQWHHTNTQTSSAWDTTLGDGVTIAILDTGVNPHQDIKFSPVQAKNFFSGTNNVTDVYGHGTKVAGTASAIGNNTLGLAGTAPLSLVLPIKVSGDDGYASMSSISQGITYAADNGARVANVSYSFCDAISVRNAANYMRTKGGVVTMSGGNSGSNPGTAYTASSDISCIAATDKSNLRTSFSSYGDYIDLAAPGTSIYTTTNSGGYAAVSGTSFSAPLAAGVYALIFSANPALTPNQADNILFSTADDLGAPGWDIYYGHGRVNAAKAVAAAKTAAGTRDVTAPSVPTNFRSTGVQPTSIALAWNTSSDDSSGIAGYSIYRSGTKLTTIAGTVYTNTNITPNTSYTYTVRAEDAQGNVSGDSMPVTVTTPDIAFSVSNYSVPVKTNNSASVSVTLTKPGTITVKYGTSNSVLNLSVQSTLSSTNHTVALTGLNAGINYYYQVVATDGSNTATTPVSSFKTSKGGGGGGKPSR
jgi:subtilisin family serine protease